MSAHHTTALIVSTFPLIRHGLGLIFGGLSWFAVCETTPEASRARRLCEENKPDVIVLDMELESGDALGLIEEFSRLHPAARVLALSDREEAFWIQRIFHAGAAGFVSKRDRLEEISHAASWILTHSEKYLVHSTRHKLIEEFLDGNPLPNLKAVETLSDRELAVFRHLGSGRGVTATAMHLGVSGKTIESHCSRIKSKLHVRSAKELKQLAKLWVISGTPS